jgi:hypothetical protein
MRKAQKFIVMFILVSPPSKLRKAGAFICNGGSFRNKSSRAFDAEQAKIVGSVLMQKGFKAEGVVRFVGAEIRGDLKCREASFSNPFDTALELKGTKIGGSVDLSNGFTAEGDVLILRTNIANDVNQR